MEILEPTKNLACERSSDILFEFPMFEQTPSNGTTRDIFQETKEKETNQYWRNNDKPIPMAYMLKFVGVSSNPRY